VELITEWKGLHGNWAVWDALNFAKGEGASNPQRQGEIGGGKNVLGRGMWTDETRAGLAGMTTGKEKEEKGGVERKIARGKKWMLVAG